ncbi:hypothetical protein GCM10010885_21390 [Alicyclobacillus cellulosilyticus]|uniref:HEPN domain-containing protein n=1 Tax=Alicyclobacillus cellulosilyticus TaxID=1003997 RepID=A0A917KF60_9BACL|nr:HEPN domain-containing protein [Alicyclobacillus cellulosilyticus]GGJ11788.1 hypothetical protein GCM10010885_21390 [Alicyclobacillus cellulosilyticus]
MQPPGQERYAQAASRHLQDAKLLLAHGRYDNAVYLSGYVAECCLKAVIEQFATTVAARRYGHDLRSLRRALVLYPRAEAYIPAEVIERTALVRGHPHRRYWPSGAWSAAEAADIVGLADRIHQQTVARLVLHGLLRKEDLDGAG